MSIEAINERIAIKNLIFTKALPNHIIPVPTDGYKTFACIDCGDKFLFETSYNYHRNRKSLNICYFCRYCSNIKIFYNRCKFLSHIRSHPFKTATINVCDIKLNPLCDEDLSQPTEDNDNTISILTANNNQTLEISTTSKNDILIASNDQISDCQTNKELNCCYECHEITNKSGVKYKDRADHYMKNTMTTLSCPICLFLLPTLCALEAHLRIHLRIPPYFCPECGVLLPQRCISYPFNHDCEGMKMMKAAVRLKCLHNNCKSILHPNAYKAHFKTHFTQLYICSFCLEKTTNKTEKCKRCNKLNVKNTIYLQCPLCTKKKILHHNFEAHLNYHCKDIVALLLNCQIYQCKICNTVCDTMYSLLNHCITIHKISTLEKLLWKVTGKAESEKLTKREKVVYHRVLKRCNKCLRSFSYRCAFENIKTLPNDCPYKCSTNQSIETSTNRQIQCFLCKSKISENWSNIKTHFALFHKSHRCLDLKITLTRIDSKSTLKLKNKKNQQVLNIKKKANVVKLVAGSLRGNSVEKEVLISKDAYICHVCKSDFANKKDLEIHMITHRDPCMAYQCLECGKCFVVKPSFSTHLLLEHGIPDVQDYIHKKACYNELAMLKNQNTEPVEEPLEENQCRICREMFKNGNELEKHFRVHGMAFLIKNTLKNNSP